MIRQFQAARTVSVPILVVTTADQAAAADAIRAGSSDHPVVRWDATGGIIGVNDVGKQAVAKAGIEADATIGFVEAMIAAHRLPRLAILLACNAHRQLQSAEPGATAAAIQAVANLRDQFKLNFRMLVLLAPEFVPPPELAHDVVMIDQPLPGDAELRAIVTDLHKEAKLPDGSVGLKLTDDVLARAVDATVGLSAFEAEQVVSMSLRETGLDLEAVWDRKRRTIEQTQGLSVYRGTETLEALRGLASVKARLRQHKAAKTPLGVVVWIDEGADVFSNVEQDATGVKTDQQRALLVEMEQHDWRGMIFVGVPGSGKSAIARAFGAEAGVPTIQVDFGAMEDKYVGTSEANLRAALRVIKAVGRGRAFFVLTCNSLRGIRPQFQRRFRRGVFFFDLPTADERDAIWQLYLVRYGLKPQTRPDDDGWTGAEIRECCESAWDTDTTLLEAARYIVPVSRSRATEIEAMRREAHGRFLDASRPGAYRYEPEPMAAQVRAIALPHEIVQRLEEMKES